MPRAYTAPAKWFHWLIVFLVGLEILIGGIMPGIHRNTEPGTLVNFHFSFGLVIIAIMFARIAWRITHPAPPLPSGTSWWQTAVTHLMHLTLYALLFVIPFAGWLWANAVGWQVRAFWIIPMPTLVPKGWAYTWLAADAHVYLVGLISLLIAVHVVAALWHWFVHKDGVLERMLPEHPIMARTLNYFERFR